MGVLVVVPTLLQVALAFALPQPFHFVASLGFFQVPASAVPWRFGNVLLFVFVAGFFFVTLNCVSFCFKLPLAFKVGVFNNYGGEWLPRASQWTVLAAGAVLGHGAAEAAFRASTDWPERFQVALPATRAGMVRQRQILRAWLNTNRGLFSVELTFLRETPLGV